MKEKESLENIFPVTLYIILLSKCKYFQPTLSVLMSIMLVNWVVVRI